MIVALAALAEAATLSVRLAHSPWGTLEQQVGGTGHTGSLTVTGGELGVDLRMSDFTRFGASFALSVPARSVGVIGEWAPRGWTKTGFVLGARVSASVEFGVCCGYRTIDGFGSQFIGPMLQLRPGVRFAFGPGGYGATIAPEGRISWRGTYESAGSGIYAGGLVGVVLAFDAPIQLRGKAARPSK